MFQVTLKDCPFCGGRASLFVNNGGVCVICNKCGSTSKTLCDDLSFTKGVVGNATAEVVKCWNARAKEVV